MQVFTAIPFSHWYKKMGGQSIFLDFEKRTARIILSKELDYERELSFSPHINSSFDIQDLLDTNIVQGAFEYFVYPSEPFLEDTLWRIQRGFSTSEPKPSYSSFSYWYRETKSSSIELDFDERVLNTFSEIGELVDTLAFSKSIDSDFDLLDLFNQNPKEGDFTYGIFSDGFDGKNYLWRRKIAFVLSLV
ncbi:hypothetical protein GCM10009119_36600 [Algoriphagus jejuensis]|uniref:Uncharacterized protein n=1 Tax=Algoriphagus jejuensis TaxID=419934 RepID=A0ABN1N4M3_9BACT